MGYPRNYGAIFTIGTDGTGFAILHAFNETTNGTPGLEGARPDGRLVLSGTTSSGGAAGFYGTVFSLAIVPALSFTPYNGSLILSWPTYASEFALQSTTNLLSPVWEAVPSSPVQSYGQNLVIEPTSGPRRFYRLAQ